MCLDVPLSLCIDLNTMKKKRWSSKATCVRSEQTRSVTYQWLPLSIGPYDSRKPWVVVAPGLSYLFVLRSSGMCLCHCGCGVGLLDHILFLWLCGF